MRYWLKPTRGIAQLAAFCVVIGGALALGRMLDELRRVESFTETEVTAEQVALRLSSWLDTRLAIGEYVAARCAAREVAPAAFRALVEDHVALHPGLYALGWIDPGGTIRIDVPDGGDSGVVGADLDEHPAVTVRTALADARRTRAPQRTGLVPLLKGGRGLAAYFPVVGPDGALRGFVATVFRLETLVGGCLAEDNLRERFDFRLLDHDGTVLYEEGTLTEADGPLVRRPFDVLGRPLRLELARAMPQVTALGLSQAAWVWLLGVPVALLAAVLVGLVLSRQEAVYESRARFRQLAEHVDAVFWLTTPDGQRMIYVSPPYERVYGRPIAELYEDALSFLAAVHPDDRHRVVRNPQAEGRLEFEAEYRIVRPDGAVRWVRSRGFPVRNRHGTVYRLAGITEDVTERRAAEEVLRSRKELAEAELVKLQDELVRRTRLAAIGQVAASVAHDLRNPLGAVRNAAFFLRRYPPKDRETLDRYLKLIDREVDVADHIIGGLLELSRPKEPQKGRFDLPTLVREVCQTVDEQHDAVRCVWAGEEPFVVHADRAQMRQALQNLVTNAVQALDGAGTVTVEGRHEPDADVFVVRDDGPGVPEDVRARVFEPLFTTRPKGTGLGLTICAQIVERHGGTIRLLDDPPPGARFEVRLPREADGVTRTA